jgi:hypothetical protein
MPDVDLGEDGDTSMLSDCLCPLPVSARDHERKDKIKKNRTVVFVNGSSCDIHKKLYTKWKNNLIEYKDKGIYEMDISTQAEWDARLVIWNQFVSHH